MAQYCVDIMANRSAGPGLQRLLQATVTIDATPGA